MMKHKKCHTCIYKDRRGEESFNCFTCTEYLKGMHWVSIDVFFGIVLGLLGGFGFGLLVAGGW